METTIQFCTHILLHPILCLEQKSRYINSTNYEEANFILFRDEWKYSTWHNTSMYIEKFLLWTSIATNYIIGWGSRQSRQQQNPQTAGKTTDK